MIRTTRAGRARPRSGGWDLAVWDLMRLTGNARAMLTAERSALNTVQHLSGIATMSRAASPVGGSTHVEIARWMR